MIYINYIEKRPNSKGTLVSWGLFFCEYCEQYVERPLSHKNCKSCGCVHYELTAEARIGQKRTEETRMKQSKSLKGKKRTKEQRGRMSISQKGKKKSQEVKEKISKATKGINNPMYGKNQTKATRDKISKTRIEKGVAKGVNNPMYGKSGELAPNWNNGSSFLPYPPEFNKELKQLILERDNYTCQCPDCEHISIKLDTHHIDFDKTNNNPENLIILCSSCHSKTNGKKKRQYYTEFYQNIMTGKLMECLL